MRSFFLWLLAASLLAAALILWGEKPGSAEASRLALAPAVTTSQVPFQQVDDPARSDFACRLCHQDTTAVIEFPSGETISAQIDPQHLALSAHGTAEEPLACTSCHDPNDYRIPHDGVTAPDYRSYQVEKSAACVGCHQPTHLTNHPDMAAEEPVVCTDCHDSHEVQPVDEWETTEIVANCVQCHEVEEGDRLTAVLEAGLFTSKPREDEYCLACHTQPDMTLTFANGDTKSLTIDAEVLRQSVHGEDNPWQPLACRNCHEGDMTYPHEPVDVDSLREYSLEKYPTCASCHDHNYDLALDSVHGAALEEGELEAAVCTDCHGSHDTPPPDEPRERISHTCQQCHSTIFDDYAESVHGEALLEDGNEDVPTCIDCHGVHNINDPTTDLFRTRSPELCASCHANTALMNEYDISTDVFDTYVADFHGTTVTLFEHEDPNSPTNKAVCYDCHGVHKILDPNDPEAGIKANLLETCQQCHPDATTNFPDAWTSHFRPSLQHNPLVYLVNLFYAVVIPITLLFFAFLIGTDIYRRIRMYRQKK